MALAIYIGEGLVLQLHAWDEENHPNLKDPDRALAGPEVLVRFEVEDYASAAARARDWRRGDQGETQCQRAPPRVVAARSGRLRRRARKPDGSAE